MAIAANFIIIPELIGLHIKLRSGKVMLLAFYTQVSNIITLISSVAFLLTGGAASWLRYLSTCMLVMTFLVTLFVLVPMGGGLHKLMFSGNGLFHHTLCPIISTASYVLLEPHSTLLPLPVVVTLIYGIIMLIMNALNHFDGPYPFLRVHNQSILATILWMVALVTIITIISLGVIRIAG